MFPGYLNESWKTSGSQNARNRNQYGFRFGPHRWKKKNRLYGLRKCNILTLKRVDKSSDAEVSEEQN